VPGPRRQQLGAGRGEGEGSHVAAPACGSKQQKSAVKRIVSESRDASAFLSPLPGAPSRHFPEFQRLLGSALQAFF
jgi:hypothetical protein